jgi:hypothetical protein
MVQLDLSELMKILEAALGRRLARVVVLLFVGVAVVWAVGFVWDRLAPVIGSILGNFGVVTPTLWSVVLTLVVSALVAVALVLFVVYAVRWLLALTARSFDRLPQLAAHVKDQTLHLLDYTRTSSVIGDRIFEDCDVWGPAVVLIRGTGKVKDCSWDGGGGRLEDLIILLPDQGRPTGAILFQNCQFIRCKFHRISYAGTQRDIDEFKGGTSVQTFVPMKPKPAPTQAAPPTSGKSSRPIPKAP